MDRALDLLKKASTRAEKKAAIAAIQKIWTDTIPSAAIMSTYELIATSPKVRGLILNRDTVPLFHKAYITK
jgi:ABC-type transport system substrate-binding protein